MGSMIEEILAQLPADELAGQLGTDPNTATDAARKALPALLGGLSSNVAAGGGDALGAALQKDHDGSLLDGPDPLGAVDVQDGQKILGHIFGDQQGQVVDQLGATSGAGSSIFAKLLPMLAPMVLSWVGKRLMTGMAGQATSSAGAQEGGLGDVLGQMAGGSSSGGSGGMADILGGLLGGEVDKGKSQMPDLGGLFDILGGGR